MNKEFIEKLLQDLDSSVATCKDTHVMDQSGQIIFSTNSLLVASLSPMMAAALEASQADDNFVIILSFNDNDKIPADILRLFFQCTLHWNVGDYMMDHQSLNNLAKVLDLFAVPFNYEKESDVLAPKIESRPLQTREKRKFPCSDCDADFSSAKLRRRHLRTIHSEVSRYGCEQCGRRCRGPAELAVHLRTHSKEKPFGCDCGKAFVQRSQLNDHISKVHFKKSTHIGAISSLHTCTICGKELSTSLALKRHVKVHARLQIEKSADPSSELTVTDDVTTATTKDLKCTECGKLFTQQSHLNVHIKIVHDGVKPFMCSTCGRQFAVKSNLKKHLRMHDRKQEQEEEEEGISGTVTSLPFDIDLKSVVAVKLTKEIGNSAASESLTNYTTIYVCEYCGKQFDRQEALRSHSVLHTKSPITCEVCSASFNNWSALKIHRREHTGSELYICDTCQLRCVSRSALSKHELTHTGEKPHVCDECGRRFVQKSHLNYHLKVHHGPPPGFREKRHACSQCDAKFTTSSTLRKHERIHSDDRRHVCQTCGKKFIQKVHLMTHELRHTGDRPYVCNICSKSFITNANLSEHIKNHATIKSSFVCSDPGCGARYANQSDLKIHMRKHTGELPFVCSKCGSGFRSKRHLGNHFRSAHASDMSTTTFLVSPSCKNCGKILSSSVELKLHLQLNDSCRLATLPEDTFVMAPSAGLTLTDQNLLLHESETVLLEESISTEADG